MSDRSHIARSPEEAVAGLSEALEELADTLEATADKQETVDAISRAIPIVRRLDADAVPPILKSLNIVGTSTFEAKWRAMVVGSLRGVAAAARIEGPARTGTSPSVVIHQQATASADARAQSIVSLDIDMAVRQLQEAAAGAGDDVQALVAEIVEAAKAGDKSTAIDRALKLASLLAASPGIFDAVQKLLELL